MLSTDAELSGDMMFILGGLAEERTVPVGASFGDRGIRNDALFQHDAVAAQLMIPIAAGGAPQPAATASSASSAGPPQPAATASSAAGGAPQPAATASSAATAKRADYMRIVRERKQQCPAFANVVIREDEAATRLPADGVPEHIGGSTRGVPRFLLDGCDEPDVDSFLAGR